MGGARPVDWPEISGFSQACGPFAAWERTTLRDMAKAFCEGHAIGTDPMGKAPIDEAG